jgi:transcriptional regulator with XRE-family HTH domain
MSTKTKAHARMIDLLVMARKKSGIPQDELAKQIGRSQSWVARVESGNRRLDVVEFMMLTRALGLSARSTFEKVAREFT